MPCTILKCFTKQGTVLLSFLMIILRWYPKLKVAKGTRLKILTPKQMLQRLPIALTQVKAGNNSENSLNEIRQIVYSLYRSKEITTKVYNKIIKSMQ